MKWAGPAVLLVALVAIFATAPWLRGQMSIEATPEGVRTWVAGFGWKGPAFYVALVTFRGLVLIPSMVVLSAGGLVFGAVAGTLLGALGIVISALYKFSIARWVARDWVRSSFGEALRPFEQRLDAAGPLLVGLGTAHPMGPITPLHWAAGFASLPVLSFLLAVCLAGPVRAGIYAFFGSTLLDMGSPRFWIASAVLLAVALLPLVHPGLRRRILAAPSAPSPDRASEGSDPV